MAVPNPQPKMSETRRKQNNAQRLAELNPLFRRKVEAVLRDLEFNGLRPYIATGFRSLADQAKKLKGGFSKVSFSFHNCRDPKTGKPDSLAVDIVDADLQWDAPKSFWLKLASTAEAHGLEAGAFWGLPLSTRLRVRAFIKAKKWNIADKLGWDVAHINWEGISLGQAKAGVRPKA